jgi:hypothetical protein
MGTPKLHFEHLGLQGFSNPNWEFKLGVLGVLPLKSHVFPNLYGCVFHFITFMLCIELVFDLIQL